MKSVIELPGNTPNCEIYTCAAEAIIIPGLSFPEKTNGRSKAPWASITCLERILQNLSLGSFESEFSI